MTSISVVMNAFGDEPWISSCLACVAWADEIVVTDMGVSESTRAAVSAAGARVIEVPLTPTVEPARAAGVAAALHEWVLVLDPDELVPVSLADRLKTIATGDEADVVYMSWRNFLLGKEIRHSGWGMHPDRHGRFFRKGHLTFEQDIHSVPSHRADSRVLVLEAVEPLAVVHFNYTDVSSYLDKLQRYTSSEAQQRPRPTSGQRACAEALKEVWRRLVTHRGFRDGWRGWFLSLMQGVSVLVTWAKSREASETGGVEGITATYQEIADMVLSGHLPNP